LEAAFGIDFRAPGHRKEWLAHMTELILIYCRYGAAASKTTSALRPVNQSPVPPLFDRKK
jgi:hypothetical protein